MNKTSPPRSFKGHPLYITALLMKQKQEGEHQGGFHKKLPCNVYGKLGGSKNAPKSLSACLLDCLHNELVNYTFPRPVDNLRCKCHSDIFTLQIFPSAICNGATV